MALTTLTAGSASSRSGYTAGTSNLDGNLKNRYGDLHKLVVKQFAFQRKAAFRTSKQVGNAFKETALLQNEHGVTYAGPEDDAYQLRTPIAGKTQEVSVQGSQHILRAHVGINAVRASATNEQAFASVFDLVTENSTDSLRKRIEIDMFYGQVGLGTVAGISSDTITITTAHFAAGIWAGAEGAVIELFDEDGSGDLDPTDKHEGGSENHTITNVDIEARQITVDTIASDADVGDHIVFAGMVDTTWLTQLGLHAIAGGPTTLFGITTANFSLWNPAQYSAGSGALTFEKVNKASVRAINRGFAGDMTLMVNPSTWADMLNDEAALRRDSKRGSGQIDVGHDGITFHTAAGTVNILSSIYVREGSAYLIPSDGQASYKRIGVTDVTMSPLGKGESFIERVPDYAAYEMLFVDIQALYCSRPGYTVRIDNIVNAS